MISTTGTACGLAQSSTRSTDGFPPRLAAAIVAFAALLVYSNSFRGQFVMDDVFEIAENPALLRLWPPLEAMFVGRGLPARPLPYLSFAIDRTLWGSSVFGYHLTNLAIHVIAALALFDLARRTLSSPRLAAACGRHATGLALAIAVLWAVHPLQTQAVTYVYQRIESMAGMFVLLSLAAFARAAFGGWGRGWLAASAAAAVAAAFSKETAVVLPLLVLAYDWTFVARDGREIARRWRWYALLASTWAIVASLLWFQRGAYDEFKDRWHGGPIGYAVTQPGVILHYLRLAFWPSGQCFDYEWPPARTAGEILPPLAVILAALFATAVGLRRRSPWAWLGAAFFLTLAPSSSIVPVMAMAAEHRMYLPLAAVVATVVIGTHAALAAALGKADRTEAREWGRGWPLSAAVVAAAAVLLGIAAHRRNEVYHDQRGMWRDVLERAPGNFRGHLWQAVFADEEGDLEAAMQSAARAVQLHPFCDIFGSLAVDHASRGDFVTAERLYAAGLAALEGVSQDTAAATLIARYNLATMHVEQRRFQEAETAAGSLLGRLEAVLGPEHPATLGCRTIVAAAANRRGDYAAAAAHAGETLAIAKVHLGVWHPTTNRAAESLARALHGMGRDIDAEQVLRQLLGEIEGIRWWRTVDSTSLERSLATLLEETGRPQEALPLHRSIRETLASRFGEQVKETRQAEVSLALCEAALAARAGDPENLLRKAENALAAAADGLGLADPLTQRAAIEYAAALFQQGEAGDAEAVLRTYLKKATEPAGRGAGPVAGADLAAIAQALAGLLERTGRVAEAIPIRRRVLKDCLDRYGPDAEPTQRAALSLRAALEAGQKEAAKVDDGAAPDP